MPGEPGGGLGGCGETKFQIPCTKFQTNSKYQIPNTKFQYEFLKYQIPNTKFQNINFDKFH